MSPRIKKLGLPKLILIFSCILSGSFLFADNTLLKEAETLEHQGESVKAYETYKEWLKNYSVENLYAVLLKLQNLETNPKVLKYYYESYVEKLTENAQKSGIYHTLGLLSQLLGDFEKAADFFFKAANLKSGDDKFEELLLALGIYYQLGFFSELKEPLESIESENADIIGQKLILQIKLWQVQDDQEKINQLLTKLPQSLPRSSYYPQFLLAVFEFYFFSDQKDQANKIFNSLKKNYAQSVEFFLAEQILESKQPVKYHYHLIPADMFNSVELESQIEATVESKPEVVVDDKADSFFHNETKEPLHTENLSNKEEVIKQNDEPEEKQRNQRGSVQIGSYLDRENALEQLGALQKAGFSGIILEKKIGSKIYHRVLANIPETYSDHKEFLKHLKNKGFPGFLYFDN